MKIETKYDIGQEVWFEKRSRIIKGVIYEIDAYTSRDNKLLICYGIEGKDYPAFFQEPERIIYPTKEELLKSL